MIFKDKLKLEIELCKRGFYPYGISKALRYFSDEYALNELNIFNNFKYEGNSIPIKVRVLKFEGYGSYGNEYEWEI